MSVGVRRIPRKEALAIAERVLAILAPVIARGVIVGSLRRERPDVGDIELLVAPTNNQAELFGEPIYDFGAVRRRVEMDVGQIRVGGTRMLRVALYDDPSVMCDVFLRHPPAQWGSLLAIRTGPAELGAIAMRRLIARGYQHRDGHVIDEATRDVVATETEEQFFALAGLPCVLPSQRDRLCTQLHDKTAAR